MEKAPDKPLIKQAFILGAGLGTRLRPLTSLRPKPLVPVFQDPMVVHTMRRIRALGVKEMVINTHHLASVWNDLFPSGTWEDCSLQFSYEPILLDTGGGLKNIAHLIDCDAPLLIHNGDILSTLALDELVQDHLNSGAAVTLALRSQGHIRNVGFDPVSRRVTDMRHSLGVDPGNYQFTGIYCVNPAEILPLIPSGDIVSIIPALLELIKQEKVHGYLSNDSEWMDLGTPDSYLDVHEHPEAILDPSHCMRISPMADISPDASIDSFCSIGSGAKIGSGVQLNSCVVWPHAEVPAGTIASRQIFLPNCQ